MYIKENVVLHKTISSSFRMSLFYSMADVFVLCSERETFSMVCAESICCGTRICGFKCGAPETVFEEPYAHFVGYGDLNNLIRSIFDIIYMGSKDISSCRNYGLRKFDSLKIYNQWAEIYGLQKEQKENEYWEYRK